MILVDKDEKFGERFTKLCYLLNKSDKLQEAFHDKVRSKIFKNIFKHLMT